MWMKFYFDTLIIFLHCCGQNIFMEKCLDIYQGRRNHFTFGQVEFSGVGESVEMR